MKLQLGGLVAAAALTIAGSASAATTLNLDGGGVNTAGATTIEGLNVGNIRTYTSGSVTVTAQGWTYDNSYDPAKLLMSNLGAYSGLGLGVSSPHVDDTNPTWWPGDGNGGAEEGSSGNQHTVDNNGDGRIDFILLKFSTAVDLTSVYLNVYDVSSSSGADGDATAFYKNGATGPTNGGDADAYLAQFTGIDLAGNGSDGSRNIGGVTYSNTWLIAAANYGTNSTDRSNDGFKVQSISFDVQPGVPGVPEPATWAMMLMGFFGLGSVVRRQRKTGVSAIAA